MPADLLIYAIVAAGLVFWLRNILGTRHGGERQRPNPFTAAPDTPAKQSPARPPAGAISALPAADAGLERHMAIAPGEDIQAGLGAICAADRDFDLPHFMRGAQDAFIMIVQAFAEGDRATLRDLLADAIYRDFMNALDARAKNGETASVEIHAVRRAEITAASLKGRDAYITVRFVADETNVLRDRSGALLAGHPDRVTETIDIWTFTRSVKSRDPAWLVHETRDEDATGQAHKTVPDSV